MIEPFWTNATVILFWQEQGSKPIPLPYVDIEKVWWKDPAKARIVLCGPLPGARSLLRVADGDVIELLHDECSNPWDYISNNVVMRFSNCAVRRRWIPSTAYIGHEEPVVVYVSLECELGIDV